MNEKLNTIKSLLKNSEYEKATKTLKEHQAEFPNDWNGKLMEDIIAKLQGDEETFRRIHDEAQAIIDGHGRAAAIIQKSPLWQKYCSTWKKFAKVAIIGLLVGGAIILSQAARENTKSIEELFNNPKKQQKYDGPEYYEKIKYEFMKNSKRVINL